MLHAFPQALPVRPGVAAVLTKEGYQPAPAKCRLRRYRVEHIYDAFINSALDASHARAILAAVGGNVETLLVQTFRELNFLGEPPDWGMPEGTSPVGFLFGRF